MSPERRIIKSEAQVSKEFQLEASKIPGLTVWRNNRGKLQDKRGRWVEFGLCNGASDFIGIRSIVITQDMVGTVIGQFVAFEIKAADGRLSPDQRAFLEFISSRGGKALEIKSAEELSSQIPTART